MIKAIEGVITQKMPAFVVLKTASGISYGLFISLFCSAKLETGAKVELKTTQIIREDANLLYGFLDASEQKMFEILIKLNGSGDAAALQSVPGIGPKSARRIIAELGDAKLIADEAVPSYQSEALMALEALGFKRDKIVKILSDCEGENMGDNVKEALKKLA